MHQETRAQRIEREREEYAMSAPHGEAANRTRLDRVESDGRRKGRRGDGRQAVEVPGQRGRVGDLPVHRDRKSTRLNSSHSQISYAVFCLKKKKFARTPRLY